jgi:acylphosphatase
MNLGRRLSISGRVQGVGFRHALRGEALARGVRGWVRNRRDGSVEALLQGEAVAVEAVIAWARRGPPAARVDRVEVVAEGDEAGRACAGFEELPTA